MMMVQYKRDSIIGTNFSTLPKEKTDSSTILFKLLKILPSPSQLKPWNKTSELILMIGSLTFQLNTVELSIAVQSPQQKTIYKRLISQLEPPQHKNFLMLPKARIKKELSEEKG